MFKIEIKKHITSEPNPKFPFVVFGDCDSCSLQCCDGIPSRNIQEAEEDAIALAYRYIRCSRKLEG